MEHFEEIDHMETLTRLFTKGEDYGF
jgi:hypothetical protein